MNPLFLYNILRQTLCIILVLAFSNAGFTQNFTTSEDYDNAYSLLLDLKFSKAGELIQNLKASEPQNLAPLYLEDLSDFLYIVVTEDQKEFEARKELRSQRLKALNRLPDSSPYKLLAEGEIHLHWAFSMMRFGEYFNGAMAINKAFKALEKNIEIYPDFLPTYKSMGLLHTLIGTVPDNYRWATNLMGVDGTIELGIGEMEMVIAQAEDKPEFKNLRKETLFLLSFLVVYDSSRCPVFLLFFVYDMDCLYVCCSSSDICVLFLSFLLLSLLFFSLVMFHCLLCILMQRTTSNQQRNTNIKNS